jgi:ABC-type transporter Mla subunit MlaD
MTRPSASSARPDRAIELDAVVGDVERRLAGLAEALHERDSTAIEGSAADLHRSLANAVQCFMHAVEQGAGVPEPLRRRLARASAAVASQRESLARATAALDRAIDVLMPVPRAASSFYAANGLHDNPGRRGHLSA